MVWIHGGLFLAGDGYSLYGPDFLVPKDVLLVTLNYRLGPLGMFRRSVFLNKSDISLKLVQTHHTS